MNGPKDLQEPRLVEEIIVGFDGTFSLHTAVGQPERNSDSDHLLRISAWKPIICITCFIVGRWSGSSAQHVIKNSHNGESIHSLSLGLLGRLSLKAQTLTGNRHRSRSVMFETLPQKGSRRVRHSRIAIAKEYTSDSALGRSPFFPVREKRSGAFQSSLGSSDSKRDSFHRFGL